MLPSTKTLLYDALAFNISSSYYSHSFASKTNSIVAADLKSIETIINAWPVNALSQSTLFKPNIILLYGSIREIQC